jgi:hypothetical protein
MDLCFTRRKADLDMVRVNEDRIRDAIIFINSGIKGVFFLGKEAWRDCG